MLSGLKGYFMTPYDANFDPLKFDFDQDAAKVQETAALQDAEWTELSTFIDRGGKLLLYHGVADPFFSANDTERYYQRAVADNEGAQSDWARLFLVPGMTHCGGGPALDNFDALGALVDWVENKKAPERINSTGAAFPGRSRPLCAYPRFARYKGTGSTEDAANFECAAK
jgi:feruloyl esterase